MRCRKCGSAEQREVPSEINVHPPHGQKYLDVPSVFVFPKLLICPDCGFAEFVLEVEERRRLQEVWREYGLAAGENSRVTPGVC